MSDDLVFRKVLYYFLKSFLENNDLEYMTYTEDKEYKLWIEDENIIIDSEEI